MSLSRLPKRENRPLGDCSQRNEPAGRASPSTRSSSAAATTASPPPPTCARGPARVRARAPRPPRRRLRDRGAVARAARLARLVRGLDAPPKVVADLELKHFGYDPIPLDPPFATFAADGTPILFHNDERTAYEPIARVSQHDADAIAGFNAMIERVADVLRPMMLRPPPALGSRHPGDVVELLREAGRAAGLSRRELHGALPRHDDVGRRPARRLLRERRAQGRLRLDRRGRRVGGPAHAGHGVQPAPPRARASSTASAAPGATCAAAWARSPRRSRRSARAAGASSAPSAPVASIDVSGGRVTGVTLEDGETLQRADRALRRPPEDDRARPRRRRALPRRGRRGHAPLPLARRLGEDQRVLAEPPNVRPIARAAAHEPGDLPVDRLPRARLAGRDARRARGRPVHRGRGPDGDRPVADRRRHDGADDVHPVRPARRAGWPDGAREAYAQRCLDMLAQYAPNVRDAILHYEVLAPPDLERIFGLVGGSIFQGEQGLDQMAFMRPSPVLARYATPVHGLYLCGAGTHPGRRRDRRGRAQRGAARPEGPRTGALNGRSSPQPGLTGKRPDQVGFALP